MRSALRTIVIVNVCWVFALVYFMSNPGVDYVEVLLILAGTTATLVGAVLFEVVAGPSPGRARRVLLWSALLGPAVAVVAIFLGSQSPLNPLFRVRFAVSQNALVREASAGSSPGPRWIGLFHVKRVERLEGEVRFITGMCGLVDQCGLVFRHAAPPKTRGKVRLRHLTGNWYHLYDVF